MKLSFIGGGNMGEAMLAAILSKKLSRPQSICVSDVSKSRRQHLEQKYGVLVTDNNFQAAGKGDVIVLAVKSQNLGEVMTELVGRLKSRQLVLSIIAGTRIRTLRRGLKHRRIVRAMPNTPAQIGEGATVWTATSQVTDRQEKQARSILGVMGREIRVCDEKYIDMATAISGSGPAYFFLFVESLVESAVKIGIPQETAEILILQTMQGAALLIQQLDKSPAELRRMVTSPGGTTDAAIQQLENDRLGQIVLRAVTAAYNRARELGK